MAKHKQPFPDMVERFDIHQRLQHIILIVCFTLLYLTGFPIKYGYTDWAKIMTKVFLGFDNMFRLHLTAALVLIMNALYHIAYLVLGLGKNGRKWTMLLTIKDFRDAVHHIKYLLGRRNDPPQYGRYSYLEKLEYFAVAIGVVMMSVSGLVLWFPERAAVIIPKWGLDIMRAVHSNEAMVCFLIIVIGHMFRVHLNPQIFPANKVWLHGKISRAQLKQLHPLEYEQLLEVYQEVDDEAVSAVATEQPRKRVILELCGYIVLTVGFLALLILGLLA